MENTTNTNGEIKKKRGRKKKENNENNVSNTISEVVEKIPKKRGRKPKGGKIINNPSINLNDNISITNIILHLKCSLDDLNYNKNNNEHIICDPVEYIPNPPPDIMAYNPINNDTFSNYNENDDFNNQNNNIAYNVTKSINEPYICNLCKNQNDLTENKTNNDDNIDIKDINTKLKQIKLQLYKNSNPDIKSACFWCTYEYDNPSCYIPKYELNEEICGYGSFCRPECAVAYLLKENIDDTMKFERYHLLNKIYSKVYDYSKNIKPAPDPHYLLDKFYGNLNIQEYRKLLKTEHMLLVIEKPMTRILPELHENTDDMDNIGIHGSKNQKNNKQSGVYKVKRQSEKQKGPTKNEIMKENFGF